MSESVRMPIEERIERSRESRLCEALADLFYEAAVTDCYVTRALIKALDGGLPDLSDREFGDMFAEVDNEDLSEWFWKAYSRRTAGVPPPAHQGLHSRLEAAGLSGTEEDLSDLQRTGFARGGSEARLATCRDARPQ